MRPVAIIAVAAGLLVALLLGLFAIRLLRIPPSATAATASPALQADIVIPARNTAAPDFTLHDQDDRPISLASVRGRVVLLTFLDSHCKQLCPLEGDQLAQVQRKLAANVPLSLLVVSIAPQTDTAASERAFAAEHGWSGDWHWLSGTTDQLAAIWKAYSIAVQPDPNDILHSSVVYLLDGGGFERAGFASGLIPDVVATDIRYLATHSG